MIKRSTALCLAALFCASIAPAQIKKSGGAYLLRLKLTKGQSLRYKLSTTASGLPTTTQTPFIKNGVMNLSGPMTMTVLSVSGSVATVETRTGPILVPGNPSPLIPEQRVTSQLNEFGDPVGDQKGSGFHTHFPKEAVKVGQSWTASVPMTTLGAGRSQAQAKFTFQGIKKLKGKDVGIVAISILPSQQVKGGKGTMSFYASNGVLAGGALTIVMNNPQSGAAGPVTVSVNIAAG